MRISHNHIDSTITIVINPEEGRLLAQALQQPSQDDIYSRWHHQLVGTMTKLRNDMGGATERCPGSSQKGRANGALLSCPQCGRVIGICPPDTVPAHDRPVYDDGTEREQVT